ncbi:uncharacterized protein LOC116290232 [Actinia tenebrosa]|uniref:Uncharacterized protein LOC116290232 n=1 Tax=Actinia tenebrosa TaxID=6105 RepID=A0A6P8H9G2_ACTTE|nr:uncharacterized protein LOC116290232 [Actinia tenebrosa]
MTNVIRDLRFSKFLKAQWISSVKDYVISERTIVTNIGVSPAVLATASPVKALAPRTSTILKGVTIKTADSLVLIQIPNEDNIGGCVLEDGWYQLSKQAPDFPKDIPLYKSPQFDVGKVAFDPFLATGQESTTQGLKQHNVKVNVWFCPAKTHCGIHNMHTNPEMLEVHTQVYGTGRMQKFHCNDFDTLYEDVIMNPGMTHVPFTGVEDSGKYMYPWHQYYGDTDCIWMAVEYHPCK